MSERAAGVVKWFNDRKGYGFIEPESGNGDIFVHYSVINGDGFRTLVEGERVDFVLEEGQKGLAAADVNRLGGAPVAQELNNEEEAPEFDAEPVVGEY